MPVHTQLTAYGIKRIIVMVVACGCHVGTCTETRTDRFTQSEARAHTPREKVSAHACARERERARERESEGERKTMGKWQTQRCMQRKAHRENTIISAVGYKTTSVSTLLTITRATNNILTISMTHVYTASSALSFNKSLHRVSCPSTTR